MTFRSLFASQLTASRSCRRLLLVGGAICLGGVGGVRAQNIDVASRPSASPRTLYTLPQAGLWLPLTKRVQLKAYGLRLLGDQPGQLGLFNLEFKLNRYISLVPSYFGFLELRPETGPRPYDSRARLAAAFTLPRRGWYLGERNLVERRFQQTGPSTRTRALLRAEDSVRLGGRVRFTVYAYDEAFYDWRAGRWTINQATLGVTYQLGHRYAAEAYYTHQTEYSSADANIWTLAFTVRLLKPLLGRSPSIN